MLNAGNVLLGRIKDIYEQRSNIYVVVTVGQGQGRDGPWEESVACKFWGDAKKSVKQDGVVVGALVQVSGRPKSRHYDGKWYTDYECFYLKVLAPARNQTGKPKPPPAPPLDDENVGF
jgi:hypothetical protein